MLFEAKDDDTQSQGNNEISVEHTEYQVVKCDHTDKSKGMNSKELAKMCIHVLKCYNKN